MALSGRAACEKPGEERELADDQDALCLRVGGEVHLARLVLEDAQAADLVGDLLRFGLGIVLVHAEENEKALVDRAGDRAADLDRGG